MRVLVACERSGAVRRAFRALGHDAWSCDLKPARDGAEQHFQCDVREVLDYEPAWDALLAIGPDCTFLTNSAAWAYSDGPYHQKLKLGTLAGAARREAREEAISFVKLLWDCGIERIAIENPIGVLSTRFRKWTQIIQPHQFGDDASKGTCLWLKGLPPLVPTRHILPRYVCADCGTRNATGGGCKACASMRLRPRWANQTDSGQNKLSPNDDRPEVRAITYPGIAAAMAEQWGGMCGK